MLTWEKSMSRTDAQQETKGALVPYLRLTQGSLKDGDYKVWFREVLFGDLAWKECKVGRTDDCECAGVNIEYRISGKNFGDIATEISHCPSRQQSNNAPTTWLHWPSRIEDFLKENDLSENTVILSKNVNKYMIEIM